MKNDCAGVSVTVHTVPYGRSEIVTDSPSASSITARPSVNVTSDTPSTPVQANVPASGAPSTVASMVNSNFAVQFSTRFTVLEIVSARTLRLVNETDSANSDPFFTMDPIFASTWPFAAVTITSTT